jgi:hypothetical protein
MIMSFEILDYKGPQPRSNFWTIRASRVRQIEALFLVDRVALPSKRSDCWTTTGLSMRRLASPALMTDARSVLKTALGQVSTRPKAGSPNAGLIVCSSTRAARRQISSSLAQLTLEPR